MRSARSALRRRIQFTTAADALGNRAGRSSAVARYRSARRSAGSVTICKTTLPSRCSGGGARRVRFAVRCVWIGQHLQWRRPICLGRVPRQRSRQAFMPSSQRAPDLPNPDVEFMFRAAPIDSDVWFPGWRPAYDDGFAMLPALLQPKSPRRKSGCARPIRLTPILIRHNFFSHPGRFADVAARRQARSRTRSAGPDG